MTNEQRRTATIEAWQAREQAEKAWTQEIARTHRDEAWTAKYTSNEGNPGTSLRAAYDAWVEAGDTYRKLLCEEAK